MAEDPIPEASGAFVKCVPITSLIRIALFSAALDLAFAVSINALGGVPADRVLQYIASGAVGRAAFGWGWLGAGLGVVLHLMIMGLFVAAMAGVFLRRPRLARRPLAFGAVGGAALFTLMNALVFPLSLTPPVQPVPIWRLAAELCAHVLLVGAPVPLGLARDLCFGPSNSPVEGIRLP